MRPVHHVDQHAGQCPHGQVRADEQRHSAHTATGRASDAGRGGARQHHRRHHRCPQGDEEAEQAEQHRACPCPSRSSARPRPPSTRQPARASPPAWPPRHRRGNRRRSGQYAGGRPWRPASLVPGAGGPGASGTATARLPGVPRVIHRRLHRHRRRRRATATMRTAGSGNSPWASPPTAPAAQAPVRSGSFPGAPQCLVATVVDEVGAEHLVAVAEERVRAVPLSHAEVRVELVEHRVPGHRPAHPRLQPRDVGLRRARGIGEGGVQCVQVRDV